MEILLHPIILRVPISMLGILIAMCEFCLPKLCARINLSVGQQLGLSVFGLQDVVLSAPRVGIFSANKEGIVSLMGLFSVPLSEPVLIFYGFRLFRRTSPGPINRDHDFTLFAFVLPPVPAPI